MPREGYTAITIGKDVYEKCKEAVKQANQKAGFKKYRSVSHYVETQLMKSFSETNSVASEEKTES